MHDRNLAAGFAHSVITSVSKFNVQILPNGTRSRAVMSDFCSTSVSECFSCQKQKKNNVTKALARL